MTIRNTTIDFLRGFAVLLMILIHATAYFWFDKTAYIIWDYTHIVVPLFVFCSAYIYFKRKNDPFFSFSSSIKRLKRLLIPYYLFLLPLFLIIFFTNRAEFTTEKILTKLLLGSGRDLSWLVILFIYILVLVPLIRWLYAKQKRMFWIFTAASFLSSFVFLHYTPAIPFRYIMWLPWSLLLLFTLFFATYEDTRWFGPVALLCAALLFAVTRIWFSINGHTLVLTDNKYPPNIYYLTYGIFFITFLYFLHRKLVRQQMFPTWLQNIYDFFSFHSYSLFFIHFLYIIVFVEMLDYKKLQWWGFFGIVLILSIITQYLLNVVGRFTVSFRSSA